MLQKKEKTPGKAVWIVLILLLLAAALFSLRLIFVPEVSEYRYWYAPPADSAEETLSQFELSAEGVAGILQGRLTSLGLKGEIQYDGNGGYKVSFTGEKPEDTDGFREELFRTFFGMKGDVYLSAGQERCDLRPYIQTATAGVNSVILILTEEGKQAVSERLSSNYDLTVFVDDWALGNPDISAMLESRQIILSGIESRSVDYLLALIENDALPERLEITGQTVVSGRHLDTGFLQKIVERIRQFSSGASVPETGFFEVQGDIFVPQNETVPLQLFFFDDDERTVFEMEDEDVSGNSEKGIRQALKSIRFDAEDVNVVSCEVLPVQEISEEITCYSLSLEIRIPVSGDYTITKVIINEGEEEFPLGNLVIRCENQEPVFKVIPEEGDLESSRFQCSLTSLMSRPVTVEDISCGNLEQYMPEKEIIYNGSIESTGKSQTILKGDTINLLVNFSGSESELYYTSPIVVYRVQGEETPREYRISPFGYCFSGQLLPDFKRLYESRYQ